MIEHHRDDGERTQTVERRNVAGLGTSGRLFFCSAVGVGTLIGGRAMGACGVARLASAAVGARAFVRRLVIGRAARAAWARLRELFHKTSSNDENNQHIFIVAACSCECLLLAQPQGRVHIKVN